MATLTEEELRAQMPEAVKAAEQAYQHAIDRYSQVKLYASVSHNEKATRQHAKLVAAMEYYFAKQAWLRSIGQHEPWRWWNETQYQIGKRIGAEWTVRIFELHLATKTLLFDAGVLLILLIPFAVAFLAGVLVGRHWH